MNKTLLRIGLLRVARRRYRIRKLCNGRPGNLAIRDGTSGIAKELNRRGSKPTYL